MGGNSTGLALLSITQVGKQFQGYFLILAPTDTPSGYSTQRINISGTIDGDSILIGDGSGSIQRDGISIDTPLTDGQISSIHFRKVSTSNWNDAVATFDSESQVSSFHRLWARTYMRTFASLQPDIDQSIISANQYDQDKEAKEQELEDAENAQTKGLAAIADAQRDYDKDSVVFSNSLRAMGMQGAADKEDAACIATDAAITAALLADQTQSETDSDAADKATDLEDKADQAVLDTEDDEMNAGDKAGQTISNDLITANLSNADSTQDAGNKLSTLESDQAHISHNLNTLKTQISNDSSQSLRVTQNASADYFEKDLLASANILTNAGILKTSSLRRIILKTSIATYLRPWLIKKPVFAVNPVSYIMPNHPFHVAYCGEGWYIVCSYDGNLGWIKATDLP